MSPLLEETDLMHQYQYVSKYNTARGNTKTETDDVDGIVVGVYIIFAYFKI